MSISVNLVTVKGMYDHTFKTSNSNNSATITVTPSNGNSKSIKKHHQQQKQHTLGYIRLLSQSYFKNSAVPVIKHHKTRFKNQFS